MKTKTKPSTKSNYTPPSARAQAHALLMLVLAEKLTLDEALAKAPLKGAEADQRFSMLLALTTLQHLGQLDAVIAQFLEKPLPVKRLSITNALRLGAAQLLLLDTPAHAAVNETVAIVKKGKDAGLAGLVNAVLQKIVREKPAMPGAIANLPDWLRTRWEAQYGATTVAAMAEVASKRAPLDINVQTDGAGHVFPSRGKNEMGAEASLALDISPHPNPPPMGEGTPAWHRLDQEICRFANEHPAVETLQGYDDGAFFVQDVAASYPVRLLGDVKEFQVLDICAAPGGKTIQLIQNGAFVTAIDRSASRMKLVKENLKRMRMQANTIVADALQWQPSRAYDAILLDAPCTATGTWRRHPEMVHILAPEEIAEMAALQRELLTRVWSWLKPGGKLVYCVCSLEPEEGEAQVEWFLNSQANASIVPPTKSPKSDLAPPRGGSWERGASFAEIPPECITPQGYLRTLPSHLAGKGGMDGFFAVALRKQPA